MKYYTVAIVDYGRAIRAPLAPAKMSKAEAEKWAEAEADRFIARLHVVTIEQLGQPYNA